MASSDRRSSLSPGEQQRTKSRSSSRSHRTPPNIIVYEEDVQQEKSPSQASRRSAREANQIKRSESSTSNRSPTLASPTLNTSRKQRTSLKSSSPTITTNRRINPKRKKSSISVSEIERKELTEPNDSEKQDLSTRGLSIAPPDIFERKFTDSLILVKIIFLVITLRRLILSNNNLSSLPPSIGSLINLEYLDISNNPLIVRNGRDDYSCFPREFRYLTNLQTLIIAECTLKHIPIAVWNIISLQTLDLYRNKIGYIVGDIGKLNNTKN
jgi:Leucine-rich repeat (LRR) protein